MENIMDQPRNSNGTSDQGLCGHHHPSIWTKFWEHSTLQIAHISSPVPTVTVHFSNFSNFSPPYTHRSGVDSTQKPFFYGCIPCRLWNRTYLGHSSDEIWKWYRIIHHLAILLVWILFGYIKYYCNIHFFLVCIFAQLHSGHLNSKDANKLALRSLLCWVRAAVTVGTQSLRLGQQVVLARIKKLSNISQTMDVWYWEPGF